MHTHPSTLLVLVLCSCSSRLHYPVILGNWVSVWCCRCSSAGKSRSFMHKTLAGYLDQAPHQTICSFNPALYLWWAEIHQDLGKTSYSSFCEVEMWGLSCETRHAQSMCSSTVLQFLPTYIHEFTICTRLLCMQKALASGRRQDSFLSYQRASPNSGKALWGQQGILWAMVCAAGKFFTFRSVP